MMFSSASCTAHHTSVCGLFVAFGSAVYTSHCIIGRCGVLQGTSVSDATDVKVGKGVGVKALLRYCIRHSGALLVMPKMGTRGMYDWHIA